MENYHGRRKIRHQWAWVFEKAKESPEQLSNSSHYGVMRMANAQPKWQLMDDANRHTIYSASHPINV
jgi:hypothetical protein